MGNNLRAITNRYADCRIVRLDVEGRTSPVAVVQEGYVSADPTARVRLFFLTREGEWLDEILASKLSDEGLGAVIFESAAEAMAVLDGLSGPPKLSGGEISRADIEGYIQKVQGASAEQIGKRVLERYRAGKAKG